MKGLIIHDLNTKETVQQIIEMFKNEDRRDNQDIKKNDHQLKNATKDDILTLIRILNN